MTDAALQQQTLADRNQSGSGNFGTVLALMLILSGGGLPYVFFPTFCALIFIALLSFAVLNRISFIAKRDIEKAAVIFIGLVAVLMLNFVIAAFDNGIATYISILMRIATAILFFLYAQSTNMDLMLVMTRALWIIMIHACITFFMGFIVQNQLMPLETESYSAQSFYYLLFYRTSAFDVLDSQLIRNQGIFWEPGILQIYMNMLFFISTFIKKNRWARYGAAFVIMTTYSTTGIGLLMIQIIVALRKVIRRSKITAVVLLMIIAGVGMIVRTNINEKFYGRGEVSAIFRVYDLQEALRLIQRYPLTGIGMDQKAYLQAQSNDYDSELVLDVLKQEAFFDRGNSNAVLMLMATLGLPISLLFLMALWRQTFSVQYGWLFYVIVLVSNLSEPLLMTPFFLFLMISGLARRKGVYSRESAAVALDPVMAR